MSEFDDDGNRAPLFGCGHENQNTNCFWEPDDYGNWDTKCGECHIFYHGYGPKENKHDYCPYCGGRILIQAFPTSDATQN